jgi:hypothetical protein
LNYSEGNNVQVLKYRRNHRSRESSSEDRRTQRRASTILNRQIGRIRTVVLATFQSRGVVSLCSSGMPLQGFYRSFSTFGCWHRGRWEGLCGCAGERKCAICVGVENLLVYVSGTRVEYPFDRGGWEGDPIVEGGTESEE